MLDFQPSKMKFILVGPTCKGIEILFFRIFYSRLISNILFIWIVLFLWLLHLNFKVYIGLYLYEVFIIRLSFRKKGPSSLFEITSEDCAAPFWCLPPSLLLNPPPAHLQKYPAFDLGRRNNAFEFSLWVLKWIWHVGTYHQEKIFLDQGYLVVLYLRGKKIGRVKAHDLWLFDFELNRGKIKGAALFQIPLIRLMQTVNRWFHAPSQNHLFTCLKQPQKTI